ncbi:phospholipase [Chromobacterium sphagni]|uniref:Phospholipase n=1 Tax=Chromobacterium sphagni TaxID=1903179 RepID=A0A1S1WW37_9NEIS|nr:PHB depolymerase family esterase [Chromobacterium sphagni]OHX11489.1 phospholipase [Chromobacterium sphagni]
MTKRNYAARWTRIFARNLRWASRSGMQTASRALKKTLAGVERRMPAGAGDWTQGVAVAAAGARRFRLYLPPELKSGERLPLMVMLHGCGQTARSFALSTGMHRIAAHKRFLVLYPEQDRLANPQGCWNWYDTTSGRAYGEARLIMQAVDQVCLLYPVDQARIALTGLSAGASMAALLVTCYPQRFRAIVMHSGVAPGMAHSTLSALGAMRGRHADPPPPASPATSWPPLLVIQGGRDQTVAAGNGLAAARVCAQAAGAHAGEGRSVQRGQRYPMTITDYTRGRDTVATLIEVGPLGHAWSGGAKNLPFSDPRGPNASSMAWTFAARQFRTQAISS